MRLLAFIALLFGLCLFSCREKMEATKLETTFSVFKETIAAGNNEALLAMFDSESQAYFTRLAELATTTEEEDTKSDFCLRSGVPLTTRVLLQAGELMVTLEEPDSYGPMNILFNAEMLGFGYFDDTRLSHYRFVEVLQVQGKKAQVAVNVKAGQEVWAQSTYSFTEEEEKWKLNFLSSMSLMEKYLEAQRRKSGLPPRDFVMKMLLEGPQGDVRFRYRK